MPRWVTVFGRVNRLRAKPGTQAYSAWPALCAGWTVQAGMSTWRKLGEYTGISRDTPARVRGLAMFADCLAGGWLAEISADLRKAVAH